MSTNTTPVTERDLRHAEARLTDVEWRESSAGDGSFTLTGYAALFDEEATLYDGSYFRLREKIARGAFTDVLGRIRQGGGTDPENGYAVHLLIGHNRDLPMARTGVSGVGELDLTEDERGLRVFARVDPSVSYIGDLARLMKAGVVEQMSFAFTVAEDERVIESDSQGREDELRTILRIGDLYDVTVTPQGAYPQTSATIRSLRAALGRAGIDPAGQPLIVAPEQAGDPTTSAPADPVGGDHAARLRLMKMKADARRRIKRHTQE